MSLGLGEDTRTGERDSCISGSLCDAKKYKCKNREGEGKTTGIPTFGGQKEKGAIKVG